MLFVDIVLKIYLFTRIRKTLLFVGINNQKSFAYPESVCTIGKFLHVQNKACTESWGHSESFYASGKLGLWDFGS